MKNFGYFFKEGARSMFSHGFMSFAAIGVTVACLLIMGTFSLVAYNANENLADLQKENAMVAFVDDSLTESKAKALQSDLEKVDNVADCTFVSRQEARDAYVAEYDEDDMYKDLQPEVFRHRYVIHLTDPDKIAETKALVEAVSGIDEVRADEVISDGFIRWPFVFEGLLLGLFGAVIAFGLQWLLYSAMANGISNSDTMQLLEVVPFLQIWQPVAGIFAGAGILIGVGGSLMAIRRFLKV